MTAAPPSPATGSRSPTDGGTNWDDLEADTGKAEPKYSHTGLSPGETRHYRVSAINATGTSVASGTADATTIDPPTLSSAVVRASAATESSGL